VYCTKDINSIFGSDGGSQLHSQVLARIVMYECAVVQFVRRKAHISAVDRKACCQKHAFDWNTRGRHCQETTG
jgi:hypothetical protein